MRRPAVAAMGGVGRPCEGVEEEGEGVEEVPKESGYKQRYREPCCGTTGVVFEELREAGEEVEGG
jgi:hypothetical protein